jgi:hypothetical protein
MSDIRYRRFEAKDQDSVLELFEAAFGKPRDSKQWLWEFIGSPRPAIIVVAEADGKIVGHYAILPRRLKVGQSIVESGLVVDVMTHPMYGKKGIFVNSGLEAFKQARAAGLEILMGFPNEAAIRGHMKVGWNELGRVVVRARPIRASSIKSFLGERLELPRPILRALDILLGSLNRISSSISSDGLKSEWISTEAMSAQEDDLDTLRKRMLESCTVCNNRDIDWMIWRVSDPLDPTHIVLLKKSESNIPLGLGFLKVKEKDGMRTGAVMDIWVDGSDGQVEDRLLRELLRKAIEEGCELLILFGNPASARSSLLRRMLILKTPRRLRFIVRSVGSKGLPREVLELENWALELVDHDVI